MVAHLYFVSLGILLLPVDQNLPVVVCCTIMYRFLLLYDSSVQITSTREMGFVVALA